MTGITRALFFGFFWTDPNLSQEARDKLLSETSFDSQRLVAFLRSTSQVGTLTLGQSRVLTSASLLYSTCFILSDKDEHFSLKTKKNVKI